MFPSAEKKSDSYLDEKNLVEAIASPPFWMYSVKFLAVMCALNHLIYISRSCHCHSSPTPQVAECNSVEEYFMKLKDKVKKMWK